MTSGEIRTWTLQAKHFLNPVPYPLGHRAHIQKGTWEVLKNRSCIRGYMGNYIVIQLSVAF